MIKYTREEALEYHSRKPSGKLGVVPTKPYSTQRDLTLAYTPGVAEPCKEISKNKEDVYKYTCKGNLVAVISNGTAVLGLGNIGSMASKPVMEGKSLLFKVFADIDSFDIEVDTEDIDKFVETVKLISPSFGGINLEDIKAPECFEIEERLKKELDIPVMHDDQHGTAIISGAALLNALDIVGKKIEDIKLVVSGAGAAGIACTKFYESLGVKRDNIIMLDVKGVIGLWRDDLTKEQRYYATDRKIKNLSEAIEGADVFLGVSAGNILTGDMLRRMSARPIVFAMANPIPEISYNEAKSCRDDIIIATGRSDYPNQVNNVLGFPYIFRGALDVMAVEINEAMKHAAAIALSNLAKQPVPKYVLDAYNVDVMEYGVDYILPKPIDKRLIVEVSSAVAKAAIDSGVARIKSLDIESYKKELEGRLANFK